MPSLRMLCYVLFLTIGLQSSANESGLYPAHFYTSFSSAPYSEKEHSGNGQVLYAEVGETRFVISDPRWHEMYLKTIIEYGDFDDDGHSDILLDVASGAACCGSVLYLVSHRGGGFFTVHTAPQFEHWTDVQVIELRGSRIIKLLNDRTRMPGYDLEEVLSFHEFKHGTLDTLSSNSNRAKTMHFLEIESRVRTY